MSNKGGQHVVAPGVGPISRLKQENRDLKAEVERLSHNEKIWTMMSPIEAVDALNQAVEHADLQYEQMLKGVVVGNAVIKPEGGRKRYVVVREEALAILDKKLYELHEKLNP